jgi:anti-sigma regulatory factor (Ser/Thr protein kinase)
MRIVIASRLPEIGRALGMVDELRGRHGLAERDANAICVILDELLTNSIRHGLNGSADHEISVAIECSGGEIVVEIEDDGAAFDPTRMAAPDTRGTLAERKVGGLGIAFVRDQSDSLAYERRGDRNRITVRRRLGGSY